MLGKTKKAKPPGRLEQEEIDLCRFADQAEAASPMSPLEKLQITIALAHYKRQGEIIRHLQEIEGRSYARRF